MSFGFVFFLSNESSSHWPTSLDWHHSPPFCTHPMIFFRDYCVRGRASQCVDGVRIGNGCRHDVIKDAIFSSFAKHNKCCNFIPSSSGEAPSNVQQMKKRIRVRRTDGCRSKPEAALLHLCADVRLVLHRLRSSNTHQVMASLSPLFSV